MLANVAALLPMQWLIPLLFMAVIDRFNTHQMQDDTTINVKNWDFLLNERQMTDLIQRFLDIIEWLSLKFIHYKIISHKNTYNIFYSVYL